MKEDCCSFTLLVVAYICFQAVCCQCSAVLLESRHKQTGPAGRSSQGTCGTHSSYQQRRCLPQQLRIGEAKQTELAAENPLLHLQSTSISGRW